jgi:hypothetical protein
MCVDYCGLNWLTINKWYPLPLISRLLDQLNQAKVYTKIDLRGAYNSRNQQNCTHSIYDYMQLIVVCN